MGLFKSENRAIIDKVTGKHSSAGMSVRLTRERSWVRAPSVPRRCDPMDPANTTEWNRSSAGMSVCLTCRRSWVRAPSVPLKRCRTQCAAFLFVFRIPCRKHGWPLFSSLFFRLPNNSSETAALKKTVVFMLSVPVA